MTDLVFEDVYARVLATRALQDQLKATWIWNEATLEDWDTSVLALDTANDAASDAAAAVGNARAALKAAGESLHAETKQILGIAKVAFRNAPAKLGGFAPLRALGASIPKTIESAQKVSSAWQKADPAWQPLTGKTLTGYDALRASVATLQSDLANATAGVRTANKALRDRITIEDKTAKAWYAIATRVFPVGTPEGDAIRAGIRSV